eukprot:6213875-Alexandrium_andersonii.AAC.1
MARGRVRSGQDPREASVGADRRDRGGDLLLTAQVNVEVASDHNVLLWSGQSKELAEVTSDLGEVSKAWPNVDGDNQEG